eukprot:5994238-Pyramimonas_sp.AAC.1
MGTKEVTPARSLRDANCGAEYERHADECRSLRRSDGARNTQSVTTGREYCGECEHARGHVEGYVQ